MHATALLFHSEIEGMIFLRGKNTSVFVWLTYKLFLCASPWLQLEIVMDHNLNLSLQYKLEPLINFDLNINRNRD